MGKTAPLLGYFWGQIWTPFLSHLTGFGQVPLIYRAFLTLPAWTLKKGVKKGVKKWAIF